MANDWTTLTGAKTVAGSIANWLNRSDLPTANILLEAEATIFETLRVREMQARAPLTFAASTQTASLPTGFLDPISFRPYESTLPLPFVHEDGIDEYRDSTGALESGTPSKWTIVGDTAYVDLLPSSALSGTLLYYQTPAALSSSNETNWLTIRYPSMLRFACLARGYEHMKAPEAAGYMQMAMQAIMAANATNEMWRRNQYVPA